jgi:hypothetical protein
MSGPSPWRASVGAVSLATHSFSRSNPTSRFLDICANEQRLQTGRFGPFATPPPNAPSLRNAAKEPESTSSAHANCGCISRLENSCRSAERKQPLTQSYDLHREECIGITDKDAEDQRQEQREKTDNGKDHVLRAAGQMGLRQPLLKIEPESNLPNVRIATATAIEMDVTGRLRLSSWPIAIRNGTRLAHAHLGAVV